VNHEFFLATIAAAEPGDDGPQLGYADCRGSKSKCTPDNFVAARTRRPPLPFPPRPARPDRDTAIPDRHFSHFSTPTPRDRQNAEGTSLKERSRKWGDGQLRKGSGRCYERSSNVIKRKRPGRCQIGKSVSPHRTSCPIISLVIAPPGIKTGYFDTRVGGGLSPLQDRLLQYELTLLVFGIGKVRFRRRPTVHQRHQLLRHLGVADFDRIQNWQPVGLYEIG
jgi:hypothetical protein